VKFQYLPAGSVSLTSQKKVIAKKPESGRSNPILNGRTKVSFEGVETYVGRNTMAGAETLGNSNEKKVTARTNAIPVITFNFIADSDYIDITLEI